MEIETIALWTYLVYLVISIFLTGIFGNISTTMIYSHMNNDVLKDEHEEFSPLQQIEEHRKIKT